MIAEVCEDCLTLMNWDTRLAFQEYYKFKAFHEAYLRRVNLEQDVATNPRGVNAVFLADWSRSEGFPIADNGVVNFLGRKCNKARPGTARYKSDVKHLAYQVRLGRILSFITAISGRGILFLLPKGMIKW